MAATQQIADWLKKLGMSEYAQRFAENDIDVSVLPELTDQDLKDLGVSLGHRRKILRAIRDLGGAAVAVTEPFVPAATEPTRRDDAERRQLTVMFTDLVGSTALSSKLDPEDLRSVIGAYHKCVAETVARFDGFVAKYMGDGVLVYFGYPRAHEDDAERAVRAGLALIDAVGKSQLQEPLQVRIGIATGLVVVGDIIGSGDAQERGVVGETPNLAARLQGIAAPNTVVMAEGTRRLLGNLFELEDLGPKDLRGIAGPTRAWAALRASSVESRFEALHATGLTALVGREEETELLLRRWGRAKIGEGQVVLIVGEAGIGKSRLTAELLERLATERHTRMRYFCSPQHTDSALYPAIAQLEHAAGFRREDTDEVRLARLQTVLARGANELDEAVPLFAHLLSIPTGDRYRTIDLTPQKRKERTLAAMIGQVDGLARQQPVLMLYEDMHWSDPTTREALDLLIDRVPALRVLVIITFRPEFTAPWIGRAHVTLLALNRLAPWQRAEMITRVTGGKMLPREIADQIIDRTDGVPLFIEELTKSVIESGLVADAGERYALTGPSAPLAIPTTLHGSLLARLDRLAPTREVAQTGAAIGRSFSHALISAVAEIQISQHKLDQALEQLVGSGLILRRGEPPDAEYTFKHVLVQDAAYGAMLRSRRQQLHGRIVDTLESHFPEVATAQPQLVAQHCAEAGLNEKAVDYWLKAGEQALERSAMLEAEALLRKGLTLVSGLTDSIWRQERELDLQLALGRVLSQTQGYHAHAAGAAYSRARKLCEELKRPHKLVPILYGQWVNCFVGADRNGAQQFAAEILNFGELVDDVMTRVVGYRASGATSVFLGEFTAARAFLEHALALYDPAQWASAELTSVKTHVALVGYLSQMFACCGYLNKAHARCAEAIAEARESSHGPTLAHMLWQAWCTGWCAGSEPAELLRHADEVVALFADRELAFWHRIATMCRGWCLATLGRADEGISILNDVLSEHRGTATGSLALTVLGAAYRIVGQRKLGLDCVAEAEREAETTGFKFCQCETLRIRGDLLLIGGDRAAAETGFRNAIALAQQQGAKTFELRSATSLARLWRDQGKSTQARKLLAPIYGWFTEGFDTPVLQDAKALLDELA